MKSGNKEIVLKGYYIGEASSGGAVSFQGPASNTLTIATTDAVGISGNVNRAC